MLSYADFRSAMVLTILVVMGAALPALGGEEAGEAGFRPLFNGRNLDGWVIENNGQFSIRDGVLLVNKGVGWLRSAQPFGDFILRMEFRFLEKEANSGIFVRTGATSHSDENGWPDNGYQVQCKDILTGEVPLGIMIPYGAPPYQSEIDLEALARAYHPTGQWNSYEITGIGEKLSVKLNGVLITTARDIKNREGHIGIQGEHGLLEFRTISVKTEGLPAEAF